MWRYLTLAWLAAGCADTGLAAEPGAPATAPEARAGLNPIQLRGNPLWDIPLDSLTATRERPLFLPSRRPPAKPAPVSAALPVAPPPPPPAPPERFPLKLLGTIASGDNGIAICLNESNNDVLYVKMGESFSGWILRSVQARQATFEKASRQAVLTMPSPRDSLPGSASSQVTEGVPPAPAPVQPLEGFSPPGSATATPPAPTRGTWRDGDGNLIDPPKAGSR